MDLRLDGKVALVTGASRGIGRAIAAAYAAAGSRVLISSRKQDALEEAAKGMAGDVDVFAANAGEPDQAAACVAHCVERFGAIDVLVNNAATNPYMGPLMGIDVPRAEKTVRVNQQGVLVWTQEAYKAGLADGDGGAVINIASVGGMSVETSIAYYNVTKAAVLHLTRQMAAELAPGVRVNGVAPGIVRTHLAKALWENFEPQLVEALPLKRIGEPDDIADIITFLAGAASRWMTGQTLVVDGGAQIRFGLS